MNKVQWLQLGTKFFPCYCRRKRKRIERLRDSSVGISDPDELKWGVRDYFEKGFCTTEAQQSHIPPLDYHLSLSVEGADMLCKPVTQEGVLSALNSMYSYKAPGPDGAPLLYNLLEYSRGYGASLGFGSCCYGGFFGRASRNFACSHSKITLNHYSMKAFIFKRGFQASWCLEGRS